MPNNTHEITMSIDANMARYWRREVMHLARQGVVVTIPDEPRLEVVEGRAHRICDANIKGDFKNVIPALYRLGIATGRGMEQGRQARTMTRLTTDLDHSEDDERDQ